MIRTEINFKDIQLTVTKNCKKDLKIFIVEFYNKEIELSTQKPRGNLVHGGSGVGTGSGRSHQRICLRLLGLGGDPYVKFRRSRDVYDYFVEILEGF